ncbi:MAG: hypothetical protein EAZ55_10325 [Cytophagales bacterium]|nr:MAG: hypothetical protein EAZ55_10325 [Cytophagales bacterium]
MVESNFPPSNEEELKKTLYFLQTAPFAENYWQKIKHIYKEAEKKLLKQEGELPQPYAISLMAQLLSRIDAESTQSIKSKFPTHKTLFYMKRRARRLMQFFAKEQPAIYWGWVMHLLKAQIGKNSLDMKSQWLLGDALYGNSRRYKAKFNSAYSLKKNFIQYHHKEQRLPEIWQTNIQELFSLTPYILPWQIEETLLLVFLQNNVGGLPKQSDEKLLHYFNSPSAWLKKEAIKQTYDQLIYQSISPKLYAALYFYAPAQLKKNIQNIVEKRPKQSEEWQKNVQKALLEYVHSSIQQNKITRRARTELIALIEKDKDILNSKTVLVLAPLFINDPAPVFQKLILKAIKQAKANETLYWLGLLGKERTPHKDQLYAQMSTVLIMQFPKNRHPRRQFFQPYLFRESFYAVDFGWQLINRTGYNYWYWAKKMMDLILGKSYKSKPFYLPLTLESYLGRTSLVSYLKYYRQEINNLPDATLQQLFSVNDAHFISHLIAQLVDIMSAYIGTSFATLKKLPEELRKPIFEKLLKQLVERKIESYFWQIKQFVIQAESDVWLKECFFRILQDCKMSDSVVEHLILAVFQENKLKAEFLNFIVQLENSKKKTRFLEAFANKPNILYTEAQNLPESLLEWLFENLKDTHFLDIINQSTPESWENLKDKVYDLFAEKQKEVGFWKDIIERVIQNPNSLLNQRIVANAYFQSLFLTQTDTTVIDIEDDAFEDLLLQWFSQNKQLFAMDTPLLYKLVIHKMPTLRHKAIEWAEEQGISISFGLQMLESLMPDAVQSAQNFYTHITPKSDIEKEAALVLIDSPKAEVRQFGLAFLETRQQNFQYEGAILAFLAEHADKKIQTFVANAIDNNKDIQDLPFVAQFDKEMLRMRNKNRKAKENIKKRIAQNLTTDTELLLELAESHTKKEAEWAIVQIAKKVLAGEVIEEVTIESTPMSQKIIKK